MLQGRYGEPIEKANRVRVYLVHIRLAEFDTDLLISFNIPIEFSPESITGACLTRPMEQNDTLVRLVLQTFAIDTVDIFTPAPPPALADSPIPSETTSESTTTNTGKIKE